MSRSNPNDSGAPNPATRWFEWNGENGTVRYYDKEKKANVEVGSDFTFILLDRLGSVGGWHDASGSGIYSNEVKDTRQDALVVKAFKGGVLAEGLYAAIKDRVTAAGGQFVVNCYIAFKNGNTLAIASMKFKGAALGSWMEFEKAHRGDLYKKAIRINGSTEGTKGRVKFKMPILSLQDLSAESNAKAVELDQELQAFLDGYFKRTTREKVEAPPPTSPADHDQRADYDDAQPDNTPVEPITEDDIPF